MSIRKAPYSHPGGSNCWTKNCRLGNHLSSKEAVSKNRVEEMRTKILAIPESVVTSTPVDVIASIEDFNQAVVNNEIVCQHHPLYPYSIYKYSQATNFSKNWNNITRASRGLILNDETQEILARPFSKFFNYSEDKTPIELMQGLIAVSEKLDGSLGISYPTPDGLQITTAGGFQSVQADHATKLYREKYEGNWQPRKGVTYMWEIIYPENRIVVDYDNEDDIYLLGATSIKTGKTIPLSQLKEWKWKKTKEFVSMKTLDSVITSDERTNHEGYVVHFLDTDTRVKFKHQEYLKFHRFATGVNSRRIWEMLRDNENVDVWMQNVPEEFEDYVKTTKSKIQKKYVTERNRILKSYETFAKTVPENSDMKTFALAVNKNVPDVDRGYFFTIKTKGTLDDPRAIKSLWDRVKPDFEKSFWAANSGKTEEDESNHSK